MISPPVQTVTSDHVTTTDGRVMPTLSLLHVDQGIAVTSHASQGKTVDNVIVSAPVAAFAQVNEGATLCFNVPREAVYAFGYRLQGSVTRSGF
jgi:hypothetical protein